MISLASSACKSLQCLISPLTQGGKGGHLFRLSRPVVLWEVGRLQANITGVCGEHSQCLGHSGFAPDHGACAFLVYTAQAPGCSEGELSKVGPRLCALPRSKLLRFRFLGTPPRYRLGWTCVLCRSHVRAAQTTRCLVSALSQVCGASHHLPSLSCSVSSVRKESPVSGVLCVSSGELISDCNCPGRCQPSRIPGRHG